MVAAGEKFCAPVHPGAEADENTGDYLITTTKPEQRELLPLAAVPGPRGMFRGAFFCAKPSEFADKRGKKALTIIRQTVIKYFLCFSPRKRSG